MKINFQHKVPVELSLEEIEVLIRGLERLNNEKQEPLYRQISCDLETRLSSVRAELVKKLVGVKF